MEAVNVTSSSLCFDTSLQLFKNSSGTFPRFSVLHFSILFSSRNEDERQVKGAAAVSDKERHFSGWSLS